jgi:hypothetical protein
MPSMHFGSAHENIHVSTTRVDPNPVPGANHLETDASLRAGASSLPRAAAGSPVRGVSRSQQQSTRSAGTGIPARYIAKPIGDLHAELSVPNIYVNGVGLRYAQSGGNWYGVSYDRSGGTWRVVQHDEPNKPGIPVKFDANGTLSLDMKVGLRGGGGSEEEKARAQSSVSAKKDELQAKQAQIDAKDRELNSARTANADTKRRIADLNVKQHEALRRLDDASAQVSEFERKATQAAHEYRSAKDRHDAAQASSSTQQDDFMAFARSQLPAGSGHKMSSVFDDGSRMREAEQQQRQYRDSADQWREKKRSADYDLLHLNNALDEAWRNQGESVSKVSALENDRAALEGQRLALERQLTDLERERSRLA